jgi:hypothetical protein
MRKLDQRGVAAFEFCIVGAAIFALVFAIFDLGRYVITVQSLRSLAGAGARAALLDDCYTMAALKKTTPTCSGDYTTEAQKRALVPMLYAGGLSPAVSTVTGTSAITVTASIPSGFTMLFPTLWGASFNNPSASTQIPLPG